MGMCRNIVAQKIKYYKLNTNSDLSVSSVFHHLFDPIEALKVCTNLTHCSRSAGTDDVTETPVMSPAPMRLIGPSTSLLPTEKSTVVCLLPTLYCTGPIKGGQKNSW